MTGKMNMLLLNPRKILNIKFINHLFTHILHIDLLLKAKQQRHIYVFTFGGAKRSGSDRECKYVPIGMNAREPLWR